MPRLWHSSPNINRISHYDSKQMPTRYDLSSTTKLKSFRHWRWPLRRAPTFSNSISFLANLETVCSTAHLPHWPTPKNWPNQTARKTTSSKRFFWKLCSTISCRDDTLMQKAWGSDPDGILSKTLKPSTTRLDRGSSKPCCFPAAETPSGRSSNVLNAICACLPV